MNEADKIRGLKDRGYSRASDAPCSKKTADESAKTLRSYGLKVAVVPVIRYVVYSLDPHKRGG